MSQPEAGKEKEIPERVQGENDSRTIDTCNFCTVDRYSVTEGVSGSESEALATWRDLLFALFDFYFCFFNPGEK